VFYVLVEKGFFGDTNEHMTTVCKRISWPRRVGADDTKFCGILRISHLDSILYFITYAILLVTYINITIGVAQDRPFFSKTAD
jgi:hypothetical protein